MDKLTSEYFYNYFCNNYNYNYWCDIQDINLHGCSLWMKIYWSYDSVSIFTIIFIIIIIIIIGVTLKIYPNPLEVAEYLEPISTQGLMA